MLKEVFDKIDKYNEGILRRSEYIMALRTDERIIDFIDVDAVKKPNSQTVMTLDMVLIEVERDEMYEMMQINKQQDAINHKEFITWREFLTYFNDYKEIEERNKKTVEIQRTRDKIKKERNQDSDVIDTHYEI
jgi:hypothetical protein